MRKTAILSTIITLSSLSLSAQSNPTSLTVSAYNKENVDAMSVNLVAKSNLNFTEQNELLFAQSDVLLTQNTLANSPTNGTQNNRSTKPTPRVDLPKMPHPAFWQRLQDDPEELSDIDKIEFSTILHEFYRTSEILSQQLDELGRPTKIRLEAPRIRGIDQLDDADDLDLVAILRAQIEQARRLTREVESIEQPAVNLKNQELQNKNLELKREWDSTNHSFRQEINELKKQLENSKLNEMENENFKELFFSCQKTIQQIRLERNHYTVPTLSFYVGTALSTNIFTESDVTSIFAHSLGVNFNPTTFLGIPDYIDVWLDYSNLTVNFASAYEHDLNNISAGINLRLFSISNYLKTTSFNWIVKAGAGYLLSLDKIPNNSHLNSNIWQGWLWKVETEIFNLAKKFPIGVYASYSRMNIDKHLAIYKNLEATSGTMNMDLNHKKLGTINFGLKFFISASSRLDKTSQVQN